MASGCPSQFAAIPTLATPTKAPAGRSNTLPATRSLTGVMPVHVKIEVQDFLPHRRKKAQMALLAGVLLSDL